MNAVALDTLKLARSLREKAKLSVEQAEGFADALAEAFQGDLATKGDLRELELRLKAEIESARTQVEAVKFDLLKWIVGLIGLQTIAILGALIALTRNLHS